MDDKRQFFECQECGAEYSVETDMDIKPEFCPFCGEPVEILEWTNDENTIEEG